MSAYRAWVGWERLKWPRVLYLFRVYSLAMHPPAFRVSRHLSDWPDCRLELNCCRGQVVIPVRLLIRQHGSPTFATILARLRCQRCKGTPAPVFLCAGGREHTGGAPPDWAIELVPKRGL
jgi:hypothetical protein